MAVGCPIPHYHCVVFVGRQGQQELFGILPLTREEQSASIMSVNQGRLVLHGVVCLSLALYSVWQLAPPAADPLAGHSVFLSVPIRQQMH